MFRIIVGTDGSPPARAALQAAAGLAERITESAVIAVAAEGPENISGLEVAVARVAGRPGTGITETKVQGPSALEAARLALSGLQRPKEFLVESGAPAQSICRVARERGASLVALGRTSRSRFANTLLGSVSDRVLRNSPVPVMVVPAPAENAGGASAPRAVRGTLKLLVATDGSEAAQQAVAYAGTLAKDVGNAEITVLSVQPPPRVGFNGPEGGPMATQILIEGLERAAQAALDEARTHLQGLACPVHYRTELGSTGEVICRVAQQEEADLIVVGNSGKGRIATVLLGSVSNYALHTAKVPVIVVRDTAGTRAGSQP